MTVEEAWKKLNLGGDGPDPFFQRAVAARPAILNHVDRVVREWSENGRLHEPPRTGKWQSALVRLVGLCKLDEAA